MLSFLISGHIGLNLIWFVIVVVVVVVVGSGGGGGGIFSFLGKY